MAMILHKGLFSCWRKKITFCFTVSKFYRKYMRRTCLCPVLSSLHSVHIHRCSDPPSPTYQVSVLRLVAPVLCWLTRSLVLPCLSSDRDQSRCRTVHAVSSLVHVSGGPLTGVWTHGDASVARSKIHFHVNDWENRSHPALQYVDTP